MMIGNHDQLGLHAMTAEMVARLLDEGLPCAFVLADAVYGSDARFRRMLEARG